MESRAEQQQKQQQRRGPRLPLIHERQQRRKAGWESRAVEQEEEVSEPGSKREGEKPTIGGREERTQSLLFEVGDR